MVFLDLWQRRSVIAILTTYGNTSHTHHENSDLNDTIAWLPSSNSIFFGSMLSLISSMRSAIDDRGRRTGLPLLLCTTPIAYRSIREGETSGYEGRHVDSRVINVTCARSFTFATFRRYGCRPAWHNSARLASRDCDSHSRARNWGS
jgi:hypothetical protein